MIELDSWLSKYFAPKKAYRFVPPFEEAPPAGFIYAKIDEADVKSLQQLQSQGFDIIEILQTFQQSKPFLSHDPMSHRFANAGDEEQVATIAKDAFTYSRFYQDPAISKSTARQIKEDWVRNYFSGKRGTHMIVADAGQGKVAGFILLIQNVIDLIATSPAFQKKGVASGMIAFGNKEIGLLKAGTQKNNGASIQLYKKTGFECVKSQLVLHRHS